MSDEEGSGKVVRAIEGCSADDMGMKLLEVVEAFDPAGRKGRIVGHATEKSTKTTGK